MKGKVFLLMILILFGISAIGSTQNGKMPYKIIVNPENPVAKLTKKELSKIFLKKTTRWKHDKTIIPVDLKEGSYSRKKFSKDIHGRDVNSIKKYWKKQIFSGRDVPPPELKNDQSVLEFIRENPDAIGYVSYRTMLENVKVLEIEE